MSRPTLYFTPQSRAVRARWLMEEMGVAYDLERMDFTFGNVGGEAYRRVHPLQKAPTLIHGPVTIHESTAILEYLTGVFGPTPLAAVPSDPDFGPYLQWLHFGEAGLGPAMNMLLGHTVLLPEAHRNQRIARWAEREVLKLLGFFAGHLGAQPFILARGFTAADISIGYMLFLLKLMRRLEQTPDSIQAYWARLIEREAWETATRR